MTPAVKVQHPNHWTPRKVSWIPSLLSHAAAPPQPSCLPPVSLSLSHSQPTLHTHTPQVCEWQSLTSPPHPGAPQCLSLKQRAMEITHQEASSSSIPAPPPTPLTLTSSLSVILALWDFSLHVHTCSLPLGVLSHLPCSPSRLFHLGDFTGIAVCASGSYGQNCPEERKDLALSPVPHSPCTGLLSRLQTGLPLNAWVVWVLRCLH